MLYFVLSYIDKDKQKMGIYLLYKLELLFYLLINGSLLWEHNILGVYLEWKLMWLLPQISLF